MSASKAKKARVLIVEDETETRDMLALLLEMSGYEVLKASTLWQPFAPSCARLRT
jgi:DNA-binding response OmpR family regulator